MKQVLIALDQLANAIAGGNADSTISSCSYNYRNSSVFWGYMEDIIDATFKSIHGPEHCKQSFDNDPCEVYVEGGWKRKATVATLVIPFCLVMYLPLKIYSWVR